VIACQRPPPDEGDQLGRRAAFTAGATLLPPRGSSTVIFARTRRHLGRSAGVPETTAGPGAVNEDRCRASKVGKGADRSKKPKAVTSQAPVEAAGDADNVTSECRNSRPDGTGGNGQEKHPPSDGHGRGQGGEPPPDAGSKPGQGQAGPPPNRGRGSPEKGRPIETGPRRT
jgi:hypothetical protein